MTRRRRNAERGRAPKQSGMSAFRVAVLGGLIIAGTAAAFWWEESRRFTLKKRQQQQLHPQPTTKEELMDNLEWMLQQKEDKTDLDRAVMDVLRSLRDYSRQTDDTLYGEKVMSIFVLKIANHYLPKPDATISQCDPDVEANYSLKLISESHAKHRKHLEEMLRKLKPYVEYSFVKCIFHTVLQNRLDL